MCSCTRPLLFRHYFVLVSFVGRAGTSLKTAVKAFYPDGLPLCLRACLITCSGNFMGNSSISVAVPFLRMAGKYLAGGGKTNFFTGFFLLERATFSPVKKVRMFMKKKTVVCRKCYCSKRRKRTHGLEGESMGLAVATNSREMAGLCTYMYHWSSPGDGGRVCQSSLFPLLDGETEQRKFTNSPSRTGSIGAA